MITDRENELLKMIRLLESALINQAAMRIKTETGTTLLPVSESEIKEGEKLLLGTDGFTVGKTILEASRELRGKFK